MKIIVRNSGYHRSDLNQIFSRIRWGDIALMVKNAQNEVKCGLAGQHFFLRTIGSEMFRMVTLIARHLTHRSLTSIRAPGPLKGI